MAVNRKSKNQMRSKINKRKSQYQKGGSPASDLVNEALKVSHQVKNDFVTSPRIREGRMSGGSSASNMVMSNLKNGKFLFQVQKIFSKNLIFVFLQAFNQKNT